MHKQRDITRTLFKHHSVAIPSAAFNAYWSLNYSVVAIEDSDYNIKDLLGDSFDPIVNDDIDPKQLKREENNYKSRIRTEGVWGFGLAQEGKPDYSTFIWGFVGNDFIGSGYDAEIITTLESFGKAAQ